MELKLHANRGEWVATVHTDRRAAPWAVKLGKRLYIRTGIGKSSYLYDHTERPLSQAEVVNAFDANESVEVVRVEYAGALPVGLDDAPRGYTDGCRKSGMSPESSYIKPSLGHGASGMAFSLDDARDRIERRDATIAEQAAEIERLKQELFHATEQRDKLQARVDRYPADCQWLRDEADHQREKAEKYLAVVKAKDVEIMALGQAWSASMATGQAMQDAGIQFRHVSQDIPPFVAEETECIRFAKWLKEKK